MRKFLFLMILLMLLLQGLVSANIGILGPTHTNNYFKVDHATENLSGVMNFRIRSSYTYPVNVSVNIGSTAQFEGSMTIDFVSGTVYEVHPGDTMVSVPYTVAAGANLSGRKTVSLNVAHYGLSLHVDFFEHDESTSINYIFEGGAVSVRRYDGDSSGDLIIPDYLGGYPVRKIRSYGFQNQGIQGELVLPNTLFTIDYQAFAGNSFSNEVLFIPASVTSIGNFAFAPAQFKTVVFFNPDISFAIPGPGGGNRPFHNNLMNFSAYRYRSDGVTNSSPYATYLTSPSWHTNVEFYEIEGCTDTEANNTGINVFVDDGSCTYSIFGCMDPLAVNYDSGATINDDSCYYNPGCMDSDAFNYDASADFDDGSCIAVVLGCTDSEATNYDSEANTDDGSCEYPAMAPSSSSFDEGRAVDVEEEQELFLDEALSEGFNYDFDLTTSQKFIAFSAIVILSYLIINPGSSKPNNKNKRWF